MKISILLPYKENFSPSYPGAVSIFVRDTTLASKYKKNIKIYGNTNFKNKLLKNYVNLNLKNSFAQSKNKLFVESFLKYEKTINSDLIEIHNRPSYINTIKENTLSKIFLYFHNDPITMLGSKKISERINLIEKSDQIIFNSNWSKKRFLIGLDDYKYNSKISVIYQSTSKTKVDFNKKKNLISFVGKLNSAKGYDLFGIAIKRILDKHKNWSAVVIGDEPREKLNFFHNNLKILGFKSNDYILNLLKTVSISVVCSRWQEPFGRASLEACSRGSATIISNRGGLPETTNYPIIIKKLSTNELFNKINYLIKNKKYRLNIQKKNYQNFKYSHQYITNLIDNLRNKISVLSIDKNKHLNSKSKLKILHITNFNERYDGRLHYNTGRRINNGLVRLGHNVFSLSDRDLINRSKKLSDINGTKTLNLKIINICKIFKPNLLILGHADGVYKTTIDYLKKTNKHLKIAQWFLDPITKHGPDYKKNRKRILDKAAIIDSTFITTHPSAIDFKLKNSYFIPNPCDESFETLKNYSSDCENDVFFAMSHGVHRGILKEGKFDNRELFIKKLLNRNKKIKFDIYGMNNVQPIWGVDYIKAISNSKMALNLSRGKPVKYYSSDRISQSIGNGLLTFIDKKTKLNDLLNEKEVVFYNNINDLSKKINKFNKDVKQRTLIAKNGRNSYFKKFNSSIVAKYIIYKTMKYKFSYKFFWEK